MSRFAAFVGLPGSPGPHRAPPVGRSIRRFPANVEALKEELADAVAQSAARVDLLERQLRAADTEAQTVREEFRQYKARAHALLSERAADVNLKRIAELEALVASLRTELTYAGGNWAPPGLRRVR